nr:zinc transporter 7 [Hydra vulgaris]
MLPITLYDKSDDFKPKIKFRSRIFRWIRSVFEDKTSRNIFCFLMLNLMFAFVELFYGIWTNSLGLISDSFHMFFDCTALLTGLIATVISRWGKNERYSYGYVRAEIMAGFMNALFLIFVAFFIFSEAVERAFHPPHVEHERLFLISVLGFFVNLIGIFVFGHGHGDGGHGHSHAGASHGHSHASSNHGHSHSAQVLLNNEFNDNDYHNDFHMKKKKPVDGHGHSHSDHGHSHSGNNHGHAHSIYDTSENIHRSSDQIMQGVFLHILADTLGSVGVIISSLLIEHFGWMLADPLCSIFISVLISMSIWPLLMDSMSILMQRTPKDLEYELPLAYQRVSQIEGVYSVQDPHFWTLCSKNNVGSMRVLISPQADASYVLSQTHGIFNQLGVKQLFVQIER